MNQTSNETMAIGHPDFDENKWRRLAIRFCAMGVILFALALGSFAFLLVSEIGSPVWPLAGIGLAMLLLAARLFALRRGAGIALALLLWAFAFMNLGHDVWQWNVSLLLGSLAVTGAVAWGWRSLRPRF